MFKQFTILWIAFYGGLALADNVDPTRPMPGNQISPPSKNGAVTTDSSDANKLRVDSILVSPTRKVVIINGAPAQEGEMVGEYQIFKIYEYKIQVKHNDEMHDINLGDSLVEDLDKKEEKS